MSDDFKRLPELGWAIFVGVGVVLGQAFIEFDAEVFTEPKPWLLGLGAAALRSTGAALLATFRP